MNLNRILAACAALFVLSKTPAWAIHEHAYAFDAALFANNYLLTNPPLPMLYYKKGTIKGTVIPYVFNGEADGRDTLNNPYGGEFKGIGGGAGLSYAFADRWGLYLFGIGSRVSEGSFRYGRPDDPLITRLLDTKATFISGSAGITRQFFGKNHSGFTLPVFSSVVYAKATGAHRIIENSDVNSEDADFDIEIDVNSVGFMFGVQAGINLGKLFQLNPFIIIGNTGLSQLAPKLRPRANSRRPIRKQVTTALPQVRHQGLKEIWKRLA